MSRACVGKAAESYVHKDTHQQKGLQVRGEIDQPPPRRQRLQGPFLLLCPPLLCPPQRPQAGAEEGEQLALDVGGGRGAGEDLEDGAIERQAAVVRAVGVRWGVRVMKGRGGGRHGVQHVLSDP